MAEVGESPLRGSFSPLRGSLVPPDEAVEVGGGVGVAERILATCSSECGTVEEEDRAAGEERRYGEAPPGCPCEEVSCGVERSRGPARCEQLGTSPEDRHDAPVRRRRQETSAGMLVESGEVAGEDQRAVERRPLRTGAECFPAGEEGGERPVPGGLLAEGGEAGSTRADLHGCGRRRAEETPQPGGEELALDLDQRLVRTEPGARAAREEDPAIGGAGHA